MVDLLVADWKFEFLSYAALNSVFELFVYSLDGSGLSFIVAQDLLF